MLRALVCCLLIISSLDGFAADQSFRKPIGIVYAAAHTKLNGNNIPANLPVFAEDSIESSEKEYALISLNESKTSVQVIGKSSATLHKQWAQLSSGIASVSTSNRYTLKNDCLSAGPETDSPTMFTVTPYDGRIYVYAEKGAVVVKARKQVRVPEGKTVAISNCGKPNEVVAFAEPNDVPIRTAVDTGSGILIGYWIFRGNGSGEYPQEKKADQ